MADELTDFAIAVLDMKWRDMDRLSSNLAVCLNDRISQGEEIDGPYVAGLLNSVAEGVDEERENQAGLATP